MAPRPPRISISVCSGVGGLDLGLSLACGVEPVVYVERDAFAASVLVARMEEKRLASAPIWDDVCAFDARRWRGLVDLVAGGTPCQDLSLAGKRAGLDGTRSRLFFEHVRIAVECEAPFFFWENVAGAVGAVPRVCEYLEERGYRGAWAVVRASDVGAPHQRARVFLLAHSEGFGQRKQDNHECPDSWQRTREDSGGRGLRHNAPMAHGHGHGCESERSGCVLDGERSACRDDTDRRCGAFADVGHPDSQGLEGRSLCRCGCADQRPLGAPGRPSEWPPRPDDQDGWDHVLTSHPELAPALPRLRGMADGAVGWVDLAGGATPPHQRGARAIAPDWQAALRTDRLRALGNGVVPAQAAHAWRGLWAHLFGGAS